MLSDYLLLKCLILNYWWDGCCWLRSSISILICSDEQHFEGKCRLVAATQGRRMDGGLVFAYLDSYHLQWELSLLPACDCQPQSWEWSIITKLWLTPTDGDWIRSQNFSLVTPNYANHSLIHMMFCFYLRRNHRILKGASISISSREGDMPMICDWFSWPLRLTGFERIRLELSCVQWLLCPVNRTVYNSDNAHC